MEQKLSKRIETCGFIMAPFYYEFVKWAEARTEHPNVYGAMRGADILVHTAHKLSKLGITNTAHWKRLYVNRDTVADLNKSKNSIISPYLQQAGFTENNNVTLIDDDIHGGKMTNRLAQQCKKLQTLVTYIFPYARVEGENHQAQGFISQQHIDAYSVQHKIWDMAMCAIPQPIYAYSVSDFAKSPTGQIAPTIRTTYELLSDCENFKQGVDDGLEMCINASKRKKPLLDYLWLLQYRYDAVTDLLISRKQINENQLTDCKKEVERLYG